jgi:hypothetical protein
MDANPESAGLTVTHRGPSGAPVYITPGKSRARGPVVREIAARESRPICKKIYPDAVPVKLMKIYSYILLAGMPWGYV